MCLRVVLFQLFRACLLLLASTHLVFANSDEVDFSGDFKRIYQIQVVSQDAGGKSSIGSGFQVSSEGHIMTNYHVVSAYVNAPDQYDIKYSTHDGKTGFLELLDFDIVSDLALLQHPEPSSEYFDLAQTIPPKGQTVYALGNPGDWGIVLVPGPTNGLVEHSYEDRVLFSGSLNSGMSGGPSLNRDGAVIGVNVATAGSQLSFLVPVDKVSQLLRLRRKLNAKSYEAEITRQVSAWQLTRVQELLNETWAEEEFYGKTLFGEIRDDFQCWGGTNESDEERPVERVSKSCETGDQIYINSDLYMGEIAFTFRHTKSVKLTDTQFANAQNLLMYPSVTSDYENSTNFICQTDFIEGQSSNFEGYHRIVTCIRAYKKFTGLYDSMLLVMSNSGSEMFKSRLNLSALNKEHIQEMNRVFVERSL